MNTSDEAPNHQEHVVNGDVHSTVTMETYHHGNNGMLLQQNVLEPPCSSPKSMIQTYDNSLPTNQHLDNMVAMARAPSTSSSPSVAMTTDTASNDGEYPGCGIYSHDESLDGKMFVDGVVKTERTVRGGPGSNSKEVTVENLEFDGNTVLCRVCGDKASGFHYGVHACEGCKGFFRRSIQQKIQYRPCLKNQMCNIMRVNRNRCQYCRLRKCIAVGMSRDAVRFGRVPKREKAKIMEQMQKVNAQLQGNLLNDVLDSPNEVLQHIIAAHIQTCEFTRSKFRRLFEIAWENPDFVECPAHMACPLNPSPDHCENIQRWDEFSSCFTPAIRGVVNFAKSIPGFSVFSQEDQVTLLKAGTFEVLLVHLACLFDSQTNTMMFTNGKLYRRMPQQQGTSSAGFLLDSMFDFADRLNQLQLTDEELALFSAMVIIAQDRPGLRYQEQVQRVHSIVSQGLQTLMKTNHATDPAAFSKLLMKIPDLRTLNTLHSEKLLGLTVPQSSPPEKQTPPPPVVPMATAAEAPHTSYNGSNAPSGGEVAPLPPPPLMQLSQQQQQHCPIRSKSPVFTPPFPGDPMLRCPMSLSGSPPGLPFLPESSGAIRPIIPHQATPPTTMTQEKELILQTPLGSFHRYPPSYLGNPSSIKRDAEKAPSPDKCSSPEDFIEVDVGKQRPIKGNMTSLNKADMRRVMTDPMVPENFRKRLLEQIDEGDAKIARMWDYDMRSSRSNSLSSSSSLESSDSAYKTISNPATPRSGYELSRSPYASPSETTTQAMRHPLHQSTPAPLPKVTEETTAANHKTTFLPTLRTMLTVGKPADDPSKGSESSSEGCTQNWMHKKLKLRPMESENDGLPPVRERAASFSTAVTAFRQKMAPPSLKPVSREAPPRLTSRSPPQDRQTFGSIVSEAMEKALLAEEEQPTKDQPRQSPPIKVRPSNPSQRHPELLSRLTTSQPISSSHQPPSRTPPPRLYPISTSSAGPPPDKHSPPPLLPMKPTGVVDLTTTLPQRSTISSLKDKLLKRIDSQENLAIKPWSVNDKKRKSESPAPGAAAPLRAVHPTPPQPPLAMGLPYQSPLPRLPPNMLYNAVQQYQALQHLQAQAAAAAAAHIHHQMAAASTNSPTPATTSIANCSQNESTHSTQLESHEPQPMNLTKQDVGIPAQIKSEPA